MNIDIKIIDNIEIKGLELKKYIHYKLLDLFDKGKTIEHNYSTYELINHLLSIGGLISGGFVPALLLNKQTKDIDIYFNNDDSYLYALGLANNNNKIDICYYKDYPFELHDISLLQSYYDGEYVYMTKMAYDSLSCLTSYIFIDNVLYPNRTKNRLLKYFNKYNLKYHNLYDFMSEFRFEIKNVEKLLSSPLSSPLLKF